MRVIGVRKHPQPMEYFEDVMGADRLHDALKQSDYIVLIMPLTERTFPLNSPRIEKIEVVKSGKVRRAKLNYLRGRVGKAVKVKEKRRG